MTTLVLRFLLERETKGALRYQEVDIDDKPLEIGSGAVIGTLYIRKDAATAAGLDTRQTLRVTLNQP